MNQNHTRKCYKEVKRIRKDYKPRLTLRKGQIISEKEEILGRRQELFPKSTEDPRIKIKGRQYYANMPLCEETKEPL